MKLPVADLRFKRCPCNWFCLMQASAQLSDKGKELHDQNIKIEALKVGGGVITFAMTAAWMH